MRRRMRHGDRARVAKTTSGGEIYDQTACNLYTGSAFLFTLYCYMMLYRNRISYLLSNVNEFPFGWPF